MPIGRGPAAFMAGMSTEKSLDFRGSSRRLLGTMRPERPLIALGLLLAAVIYAGASVFSLLQGRLVTVIVQRCTFRLREQAQAKLARLPLRYFDQQPHGEVLSRVTNDIDNISQTMQQTLSQIVTSLL